MANIDKIVKKMLQRPAEMPFNEIKRILEYFGFTLRTTGSGSSHLIYERENSRPITIVKNKKKVTRWYIKDIVKILTLEEWYEKRRVDE
ncbi:MAG: type II toxin-antitoxin system HicA family toxin [Candidatus Firestonebacteria bacterium]